MDGAVLAWSSRKKTFIHLQPREGHRYKTEDLMEVNLKNILEMHRDLCNLKHHNRNLELQVFLKGLDPP